MSGLYIPADNVLLPLTHLVLSYMSLTDMLHISTIDLIQPFCFQ